MQKSLYSIDQMRGRPRLENQVQGIGKASVSDTELQRASMAQEPRERYLDSEGPDNPPIQRFPGATHLFTIAIPPQVLPDRKTTR